MKRLLALFLVCAATLTLRAESGQWLTDFSVAKKKAQNENKPVVMLFTGSDWCPWCIKWEKEVFSTPEFQNYAKTNLVLLLVDFPNKKPLHKAQVKANEVLQDRYKVEEYPTIVVLDSKAKKLGSFNYTEGGPQAFFPKLEKLTAAK